MIGILCSIITCTCHLLFFFLSLGLRHDVTSLLISLLCSSPRLWLPRLSSYTSLIQLAGTNPDGFLQFLLIAQKFSKGHKSLMKAVPSVLPS
jgi:hypothetical protein